MAAIGATIWQLLPTFGWLGVVFVIAMAVVGVIVFVMIKYRYKIVANVQAICLTVNKDGNIIDGKFIYGKTNKENGIKDVYFHALEETLSIENAVPVRIGKKRYYFVVQKMDGTFKVINPSVNADKLELDDKFLDYKRWFSVTFPRLFEKTKMEEMDKATKRAMYITIGGFIVGALLVAFAIYIVMKLAMFGTSQSMSSITTAKTFAEEAVQSVIKNITVMQ